MQSGRKQLKAEAGNPVPRAFWSEKLNCPWLLSLVLACLTLLVFSPVAKHRFVNYDDPDYITSNSHVQGGLSWSNVVWAFTTGHASNWHPLTWLSHMLDCRLFGESSGAQHLVNLALHAANSVLLFLVLRRMTGAHWRSAIVAALFALHPLHVESVAWLSERKDVLSAFFFMLTLGAYTFYVGGGPSASAYRRLMWYLLTLLAFTLGLMSKPMLVTVPFLLLLLDFWPLGRLVPLAQRPEASRKLPRTERNAPSVPPHRLGMVLLEKVPFLALAALSSVITFIVQQKGGAVSVALSFSARLQNALVSYLRYIGKMLWPENLSVLYPHPGQWPVGLVAVAGVVVVGLSVLSLVAARRRPYFTTGWFWFVGTLVPVIGLVQVGIQSMADRYSYLPIIGLFIAITWGLDDLLAPRLGRRYLGVTAALALGVCAVLASRQVMFWRDSEALFQHAVEVTTDNYLAYNNLGYYLSGKGKAAEAMENYQKSLAINPLYEDALNNVGYALAGQHRYAEAVEFYQRALRVRQNHVEVHNNLGNAMSELGKIDAAIAEYRFVLSQKPDHADAHNNLGIALAMQGKLDEAIPHFHDAIRFKPNYASAHSNLGNALAAQRKFDEAIKQYEESIRLNPDDAQAHNNLGNVLTELRRLEPAIQQYSQALRLNPNNPEAHFNLGLLLARQGKRNEAATHFTEALRLRPNYAEAARQLEALKASR